LDFRRMSSCAQHTHGNQKRNLGTPSCAVYCVPTVHALLLRAARLFCAGAARTALPQSAGGEARPVGLLGHRVLQKRMACWLPLFFLGPSPAVKRDRWVPFRNHYVRGELVCDGVVMAGLFIWKPPCWGVCTGHTSQMRPPGCNGPIGRLDGSQCCIKNAG